MLFEIILRLYNERENDIEYDVEIVVNKYLNKFLKSRVSMLSIVIQISVSDYLRRSFSFIWTRMRKKNLKTIWSNLILNFLYVVPGVTTVNIAFKIWDWNNDSVSPFANNSENLTYDLLCFRFIRKERSCSLHTRQSIFLDEERQVWCTNLKKRLTESNERL